MHAIRRKVAPGGYSSSLQGQQRVSLVANPKQSAAPVPSAAFVPSRRLARPIALGIVATAHILVLLVLHRSETRLPRPFSPALGTEEATVAWILPTTRSDNDPRPQQSRETLRPKSAKLRGDYADPKHSTPVTIPMELGSSGAPADATRAPLQEQIVTSSSPLASSCAIDNSAYAASQALGGEIVLLARAAVGSSRIVEVRVIQSSGTRAIDEAVTSCLYSNGEVGQPGAPDQDRNWWRIYWPLNGAGVAEVRVGG